MSQDSKFFVKPKVRFSQSSDNKDTTGFKNFSEQKAAERSKGPKIRSIVSLEKPVKIVNLDVAPNIPKTVDNLQNTPTECQNASACSLASGASSTCNKSTKETNHLSLSNDNVENVKSTHKITIVSNKSLNDNANTESLSLPSEIEQNLVPKVLKPRNYVKLNISKTHRKNKLGKENEDTAVNTESKKDESGSLKPHHKSKPSICSTTSKSLHLMNKSYKTVARKPSTKSTVHVMPCHKYNKVASKVKTSPVKKTVIRDAVSRKIKPYIGPGLSHKAPDICEIPRTKEDTYKKPNNSGEKLARPEYNSIMCTINKLKELKKQKIVTDIEHLPTTYKNLVNGKISAALDFPLDEMIYKNLVDLSVDEKQLPSRLRRSKDPEPRQRDIVPLLSDFFTPVSSEEYCTPVSFKSRTPESVDNWNAFRISDKMLEWKHNMDHL